MRKQTGVAVLGLILGVMMAPAGAIRAADAPRFERLKYGLFVHHGWGGTAYALTKNPDLSVPGSVDAVADRFDVQRFVDDVGSFKVEYVVFTAWHANMNLLFPSKAMDRWRGPGHAARRDVVGELAKALKTRGIPLYLYVHPSDGHDMSKEDQERLGWNESINTPTSTGWGPGKFVKWNEFMNDVFDEMSQRYGSNVAGYWVDGGWDRVDRERIKKTARKFNPLAEFVSGMDCADPVAAWKAYAPIDYRDVNTWPGWECQVGILEGGSWFSTGGTARLSPEHIVRYTILQAGINRQGGGACWAAGPYTDGTWEPNVKEYLIMAGRVLEPIAEAVNDTYASTAFPTPQGSKISGLAQGVVATRSVDGGSEYIHVLRPAATGTTLRLPPPADGRSFAAAVMLRTGRKATLAQDAQGVRIEVPWQDAWDPIDTVIKLTGQRGYGNVAAGKAVMASSEHADWPATNAVDGDRTRGFSTAGADNPAWIVIDLGRNMALAQVHLYPRILNDIVGYNFPVDFAIEVSSDKMTWRSVVAKTNYSCTVKAANPDGAISKLAVDDPSSAVQIFPLPASTEARYVKIKGTRLKDERLMQFMEVEVFGLDPDAAAVQPSR